MRKLLFLTILILAMWPSAVLAHVLETNGNIGAVLHIDPQDDPIVGQSAIFFFEFKDKTNRFNVEQCQCQIVITEAGKEVFSQTINGDPFSFTFPTKDIYTLVVSGQPKTAGAFDNFTLTYDLRVSRTAATAAKSPSNFSLNEHTWHFIVFGAGFLVIGILYLRDKLKHRKLKQ